MDKYKQGCYNPFYKSMKEVMDWGCKRSDSADISDNGSGRGFPRDKDQ